MAVPNPENELVRLDRLARRGMPPVTVVTGGSDFFRSEAVERLLALVPKEAELRIVDAVEERAGGAGGDAEDDDEGEPSGGDGSSDTAGLAACPELLDLFGGGLFARTAFVVVRRGSNWWRNHGVTLAELAPRIRSGSGLILEAPKLDKRKRAAAAFVKKLADDGALFEFRDLYEQPYDKSRSPIEGELCKWVVARATRLGVPLQPEAAWMLVAEVGKAPAELLGELQRLRDALGADERRTPLSPAQLRGRITCSFESTPFELAEAVLGGDRRAAQRSVAAMFQRGVRARDGRPMAEGGLFPFATSWLYQQLATTYDGRCLLDAGRRADELPALAGVRQFADRFVAQVRRHDRARLERGLLALHACQRTSRLTGEEPAVLLERFLAQWFDGRPVPTAEDLEL